MSDEFNTSAARRQVELPSVGARLAGGAAVLGALAFLAAVFRRSLRLQPSFGQGGLATEFRRAVFFVGDWTLVVALLFLLVGVAGFALYWRPEERLSRAGVGVTTAGFSLCLLAATARVVLGPSLATSGAFAVGALTYIGGSLPLGLALVLSDNVRSDLLRTGGLFFLAAGPAFSMGVTFYPFNGLLAGATIGGPYALGWAIVGAYLLRMDASE